MFSSLIFRNCNSLYKVLADIGVQTFSGIVIAMAPGKYTQWSLVGQDGINSLVCGQIELPETLEGHYILINIRAASLNYRDIVLTKVSSYYLAPYCCS